MSIFTPDDLPEEGWFTEPMQLAEKNKHPRDEKIGFIEETHTYTIGHRSDFTSVTTFIHQHFPHFDSDAVIKNIMKNPEKKQAKYGDMTGDEIKAMWKKSGDDACALGDYMHKSIELFYNGIQYDNPTIEFQYFKNFQREHEAMGLKPYRTEWKVYDEELELAGAIDMTFIDGDGNLHIYDWKRSKEIKKKPFNLDDFGKTECVEHLPNVNFWHYSLQLNTYKAILEKNYGVCIHDLFLIVMHPKNSNYLKIKCADLQKEVADMFQHRRNMLNRA